MSTSYRRRLNRESSPFRANIIPAVSVLLGSLTVLLPVISTMPVMPPFGLMFLVAWRLIRPGLWPVWAGFPLGLFDDIFSGNPIGTAALLWSTVFIYIEIVDHRYLWRGFWQDWFIASTSLMIVLAGGVLINNIIAENVSLLVIIPQLILSIFLYPLMLRIVAGLDRRRLS